MAKHRLRILVFLQSSIKMTLDEFHQSLTATDPPAELTHALAGLWWDGKGDWKRAHEAAQQDEGIEGSWVHAYLHRKEGDHGNREHLREGSRVYLRQEELMDHNESVRKFEHLMLKQADHAREAAIELEALVSQMPSEKSRHLVELQVKASHKQAKEFRELAQKVHES